jgi:hypothetical protein
MLLLVTSVNPAGMPDLLINSYRYQFSIVERRLVCVQLVRILFVVLIG